MAIFYSPLRGCSTYVLIDLSCVNPKTAPFVYSISKCRYCGKEYDGDGLWDDGFCCGRCRALVKKNDIKGKFPKGYRYILLVFIAFFLLCGLFSTCIHNDDEEINPDVENVSHKSDQKKSKTVNHKRKAESNSQAAESSEEEELPNEEEQLSSEIEEDTSVEEISPSAQPESLPSTEDVEVDAEISPTE